MSVLWDSKAVTESDVEMKSQCHTDSEMHHDGEMIPHVKTECLPEAPQIKTECLSDAEDADSALPQKNDYLPTLCKWIKSENGGHESNMAASCSQKTNSIKIEEDSIPDCSDTLHFHATDTLCENEGANVHLCENHAMHNDSQYLKCELDLHGDDGDAVVKHMGDVHQNGPSFNHTLTDRKESLKLYRCRTCSYSCDLLFDLCQHKITHAVDRIYVCDLCQSAYGYFLDLKNHLVSHAACVDEHGGRKYFPCNFCQVVCKSEPGLEQQQGQTQPRGVMYFCDDCDFTCRTALELRNHKESYMIVGKKRARNDRKCICRWINEVKKEKLELKAEDSYSHHYSTLNSAAKHQVEKHHSGNRAGEKPSSISHSEFACSQISDRKIKNFKRYSCNQCEHISTSPAALIIHKRNHTGEKPSSSSHSEFDKRFSCDQCEHAAASSAALIIHKRKHTGEKPYSCDLCEFASATSSNLKKHRIARHTNEKPYSCDLCEFTCASSSNLAKHKRKHTGKMPYSCDSCKYVSANSSNLTKHKRRRHTGEKLFSCDICKYSGSDTEDLKRHQKTHTGEKPYSCDICSHKFADKQTLTRHQKKHIGEKRFLCHICNDDFADLGSLNTHHQMKHMVQRTHSSKRCEFPYPQLLSPKVVKERHTSVTTAGNSKHPERVLLFLWKEKPTSFTLKLQCEKNSE